MIMDGEGMVMPRSASLQVQSHGLQQQWPMTGPANLLRPPACPERRHWLPPRQWVPTGLERACVDPALGPAPSRTIYSHDLSRSRGRRLATHPLFLAELRPQPPPGTEPPPSRGFYPICSLI